LYHPYIPTLGNHLPWETDVTSRPSLRPSPAQASAEALAQTSAADAAGAVQIAMSSVGISKRIFVRTSKAHFEKNIKNLKKIKWCAYLFFLSWYWAMFCILTVSTWPK
jgi:hypothetical protein